MTWLASSHSAARLRHRRSIPDSSPSTAAARHAEHGPGIRLASAECSGRSVREARTNSGYFLPGICAPLPPHTRNTLSKHQIGNVVFSRRALLGRERAKWWVSHRETTFSARRLIVELHCRRVGVALVRVRWQETVDCPHIGTSLHTEFRHKAAAEPVIMLIRLLRTMPNYCGEGSKRKTPTSVLTATQL